MARPAKWVGRLEHVREVTLFASADLAPWRRRLEPLGLRPLEHEGRARWMVLGGAARFAGMAFRELSFSLMLDLPGAEAGPGGAFLWLAFQSRQLFAFCERTFFATPYAHGDVGLECGPPAHLRLGRREVTWCEARMGERPGRTPSSVGHDGIGGPVFLPVVRPGAPRRFFHAHIEGLTSTWPFEPAIDTWMLNPVGGAAPLQALCDSGFAPSQWVVRADSLHAKSGTLRVADPLPPPPPRP